MRKGIDTDGDEAQSDKEWQTFRRIPFVSIHTPSVTFWLVCSFIGQEDV